MSRDDAQTHEWIIDMGGDYDLRIRITTTGHSIELVQGGHMENGVWHSKVVCGVSGGHAHFRTLVREWDIVLIMVESRVAEAIDRAKEESDGT